MVMDHPLSFQYLNFSFGLKHSTNPLIFTAGKCYINAMYSNIALTKFRSHIETIDKLILSQEMKSTMTSILHGDDFVPTISLPWSNG